MPVFNINDLLRIAAKVFLLVAIIGLLQFFTNFIIGKLPNLVLTDCVGYYFESLGILFGLKLMLSIVVYGFVAKFVLNFLSNVLG